MLNLNSRNFPPLPSDRIRKNDRKGKARATFAWIDDLPDELLLSILDHLPGIDLEDFQLTALFNLSRVNRRFHALVSDKLYSTYNSFFIEPYLFLRTVISNAHLASRVRHVDFTYGKWVHGERKRYRPNAQDKKVVKEGLKALGIPDWKTWATDCNTAKTDLDVLYTATLMQMSKVSSITIHDNMTGDYYTGTRIPKWADLFKRAHLGTSLGRMHQFENLRSLRIEVTEVSLITLAPIFRTPSLRKISIKGLAEDSSGGHRAEQDFQHLFPRRCNELNELHLEDSFLSNDVLATIVASARNLKILDYGHTLYNIGEDEFRVPPITAFGPTRLVEALEPQKTTLESLTITNDVVMDTGIKDTHLFNLCDGLQGFENLKYLSCPLDCIVNEDSSENTTLPERLPKSLTEFQIILREEFAKLNIDHARVWQDLATNHAIYTPNLKQVNVSIQAREMWLDHDWSDISEHFLANGIDFTAKLDWEWDPKWALESDLESDEQRGVSHTFRAVPDDTVMSESSGEVSLYSD
jgi:hypothetical protein